MVLTLSLVIIVAVTKYSISIIVCAKYISTIDFIIHSSLLLANKDV